MWFSWKVELCGEYRLTRGLDFHVNDESDCNVLKSTVIFIPATTGDALVRSLKLPCTECVVPTASLFGLFWKIRFSYTL